MSLYKNLLDLIYDITVIALGLPADAQNVIPMYDTESVGALKNPRGNCVYYLVQFDDDPINRQIDVIHEANDDTKLTTVLSKRVRNLRVFWQFYGGDAFEWADTLRMRLFDRDIKDMLSTQGISLIADIPEPIFIPEAIGQQWYHRYDLYAKFNQLVIRQTTTPAALSTSVIIETNEGVVSECSVSAES